MHIWFGLSQFLQAGGNLYFASQAGFFSADLEFTHITFICGDGPEIGEDFKIHGDRVFFKRGLASGEGGLYMMDLDGVAQKRLFGGIARDFDISGNILYYTDEADGALYMLDVESESPAVRAFDDDDQTYDAVICREGGGLVVRSPVDGYGLYAAEAGDAQTRRITEKGAGVYAYYRDFIYCEDWSSPDTFYRLDIARALSED
jgi:hypothetical protein